MIVCARTAAPTAEDRRHGISLFVVDTKAEATRSAASSTSSA